MDKITRTSYRKAVSLYKMLTGEKISYVTIRKWEKWKDRHKLKIETNIKCEYKPHKCIIKLLFKETTKYKEQYILIIILDRKTSNRRDIDKKVNNEKPLIGETILSVKAGFKKDKEFLLEEALRSANSKKHFEISRLIQN